MMYRDTWKRGDEEASMATVLEEIAMECGLGDVDNTSSEGGGMAVAIAYVMQKTTYVFPILGELLCLQSSFQLPPTLSALIVWNRRP